LCKCALFGYLGFIFLAFKSVTLLFYFAIKIDDKISHNQIGEQTIFIMTLGAWGRSPQQAKMYHEVVPFALIAIV